MAPRFNNQMAFFTAAGVALGAGIGLLFGNIALGAGISLLKFKK